MYRVFPGAASAVSTPPTPFADRQSLEAELKALEQDFDGDISKLLQNGISNLNNGVAWNPSMILTSQAAARHSTDYSISTDGDNLSDGSSVSSYQLPGLSSYYSYSSGIPSTNGNFAFQNDVPSTDMVDNCAGLAAVYQMRDIDSFIANLTVPPPPSNTSSVSSTDDILSKAYKKVLNEKQGKDGVLSQEDISGKQNKSKTVFGIIISNIIMFYYHTSYIILKCL